MPRGQREAHSPSTACDCGLPPFVGVSRSARNPGRAYANCPRFPRAGHCSFFCWLDDGQPTKQEAVHIAGPGTPQRAEPPPQLRQPHSASGPRPRTRSNATPGSEPADLDDSERLAVFLVVVAAGPAPTTLAQPAGLRTGVELEELVRLLLLPASAHSPAVCTQRLAVPTGEGLLPRAPASLRSLQPPYVELRHLPALRGLAAELGWPGGSDGNGGGGLFVLDCETTGLSGRDYIHQLAVLNVATCQILVLLLRTCPRTASSAAAKVCGARNQSLHDPDRPTFGQAAPLLHAFVGAAAAGGGAGAAERAAQPPLIVAHNARFDAGMLISEWSRRGMEVPREWRLLDTLPLARDCVAGCANHQQGTLRRRFGVGLAPGQAEHDAGTDVTVLAQLLPYLLRASGAATLPALAEAPPAGLRHKDGGGYVRTFGDVQARMRGAAGQAESAEATAFTCGFCHARVVQ